MDCYIKKITVACFAHRNQSDLGTSIVRVINSIHTLLEEYEEIEFLVGREGFFDSMAAVAVRELKQHKTQTLTLLLPYETSDYKKHLDFLYYRYTNVEICQSAAKAHYKAAYFIRNKEMVDRANLILCCIEHESGGAWKAVQYARKQGKKIVNLFYEEYQTIE